MSRGTTTRWTVSVSKETDATVRSFLASAAWVKLIFRNLSKTR